MIQGIFVVIIGLSIAIFFYKGFSKGLAIGLRILAVIFWIFIIYLLFRDGRPNNSINRNRIVFVDESGAVADSIDIMTNYLIKLPNYQTGWTEWSISDSMVYIDFKKYGNIYDLIKSGNKIDLLDSCGINTKRFLNLLLYFDRNNLTRVDFYDGSYSEYLYRFNKDISEYRTDLDRIITIKRDKLKIPFSRYKIIDSTERLILLANKDAKIWTK